MKAHIYRYYGYRGYAAHRRQRRIVRVAWVLGVLFILAGVVGAGVLAYGQRSKQPVLSQSATAAFGIATGGALAYQDSASVQQYMQGVKGLGVTWVRFDFDWSDIQRTNQTTYDWARYDRLVTAASRAGLHVLGIVGYTPVWARQSGCNTYTCPPKDNAAFARFAAAVTARYASQGLHDWEIWNEPNQASPAFPAANYARLLALSSVSIKENDPAAQVIVGGLARAYGNSSATPAATYLQAIYQSQAQPVFDAVALHPYTFPALPDDNNAFMQAITNVRDVMSRYSDGSKPIWITEYGAPTGGLEAATTPAAQQAYSRAAEPLQSRMANQALRDYAALPHMGPFFWFSYQDTSGVTDRADDYFGLLRADGTKKPAYDTYKQAIQTITGGVSRP